MFSVFAASRETTRNRVPYIGLVIIKYTQCIYGMFGREITIHTVKYGVYIRCIYGIFGREITIHTVTYSVYIR